MSAGAVAGSGSGFLLTGSTSGLRQWFAPTTGALLVTAPLPIVGGSGSLARILALVER